LSRYIASALFHKDQLLMFQCDRRPGYGSVQEHQEGEERRQERQEEEKQKQELPCVPGDSSADVSPSSRSGQRNVTMTKVICVKYTHYPGIKFIAACVHV